jgi:transposase
MDTQKGGIIILNGGVHQMRYNKEFKLETVRLITEKGRSVQSVSKDIGVSTKTLYKWIEEYSKHAEDAFPGSGNLRPEDEEMRKLKRRIADLEEENAILKKATAIFAKHQK